VDDNRKLTRRRFTRGVAAGAGLALAGHGSPTTVIADDAPAAEPAQPEDHFLAAMIAEYPTEHLTPAMLDGIRFQIRRDIQRAAELRAGLENGDGPATVFRAFRKE